MTDDILRIRLNVPRGRVEIAPDGRELRFYDGDEYLGSFQFVDGRWEFTGDVDASARAFVEALSQVAGVHEGERA